MFCPKQITKYRNSDQNKWLQFKRRKKNLKYIFHVAILDRARLTHETTNKNY